MNVHNHYPTVCGGNPYSWILHAASCCSLLLYAAPCGSMILLAAPCCSMLLHATPCWSMLIHAAPCSAMLLHAAPCSSMLLHVGSRVDENFLLRIYAGTFMGEAALFRSENITVHANFPLPFESTKSCALSLFKWYYQRLAEGPLKQKQKNLKS